MHRRTTKEMCIAGTWNGSQLVFYFDGVAYPGWDGTGALVTNGEPVMIGGRPGTNRYTTGTIDEVRIYNKALI